MLQPKALNLSAVVSGMEEMLRRLVGETIELTTRLDLDLEPVLADAGQLDQVIMNLVVDSRRHARGRTAHDRDPLGRAGSELCAAPSWVRPGPCAALAVSGTGQGMAAETLTHIFEPFYTTKEKGKGTGLGLSTVYGIMKQSGGHVVAYSEPGQGAMFNVYLPRAEQAGGPTRIPEERPTPLPRGLGDDPRDRTRRSGWMDGRWNSAGPSALDLT